MVKISRRNFGKLSAAGLVTTGLSISDAVAKKSDLSRPSLTSVLSREVNLPKAKNHRVIVGPEKQVETFKEMFAKEFKGSFELKE